MTTSPRHWRGEILDTEKRSMMMKPSSHSLKVEDMWLRLNSNTWGLPLVSSPEMLKMMASLMSLNTSVHSLTWPVPRLLGLNLRHSWILLADLPSRAGIWKIFGGVPSVQSLPRCVMDILDGFNPSWFGREPCCGMTVAY